MKTIGIGIPVRNGAEYLGAALASCLKQSSPPDEILVVINNSSDRSLEIAKCFGDKIHIIESDSIAGIGDAWNAVYKNAKSDYIVMLHQDDVLDENAIAYFRDKIKSNLAVEMLIGQTSIINGSGVNMGSFVTLKILAMIEQDYLKSVMGDVLIGCSGICARRESMVLNTYRTDMKIILDVEYFIRVGWTLKVATIPQNVAFLRQHNKSTSHSDTGEVKLNDLIHWWRLHESKKLGVPVSLEKAYSRKILKMCSRDFLESLKRNNQTTGLGWVKFFLNDSILNRSRTLHAISIPSEILIRIGAIPRLGFSLSRLLLKITVIRSFTRKHYFTQLLAGNLFHSKYSSRLK